MKYANCFFFLLFMAVTTTVSAQGSPETLTDTFFKLYEHDSDNALDFIFATNIYLFAEKQAAAETVKLQTRQLTSFLGELYEVEKISTQYLGESIAVLVYVAKYEKQPLRFTFKMYKPKDKWQLQHLAFEEKVIDDFSDAVKYEYLHGEQ